MARQREAVAVTGRAAELLEQAEALVAALPQRHDEWQAHILGADELREAQTEDGQWSWLGGDTVSLYGMAAEVSAVVIDEDGKRWTTGLPGSAETVAPVAAFIAAARTLVPELAASLRLALTVVEAARRFRSLSQELHDALAAFERAGTDTNNEAAE